MTRRIANPPNPWDSIHAEWLGPAPEAPLEVWEETARSIVSENDSPDIGFRYSVNPYRGCFHACAYCYARPSHQYLGFGAGTDFDRRIVVKVNAPELLRRKISRPSWPRETIVFSGVTDCYQPLEASYRLTRRCLEVCRDLDNPVGIVTKGSLVRRDADVLAAIAAGPGAVVWISIPFADDETARSIEPGAAPASQRFETIARLSAAGIDMGVALAPVIPGLNDADIPRVLTKAREAGARRAFLTLLRLPAETREVFRERLVEAFPHRAERIWSAIRQVRGGLENDGRFGARMAGTGPRWEAIEKLFEVECRRLGFNADGEGPAKTSRHVRSAAAAAQGELFPAPATRKRTVSATQST